MPYVYQECLEYSVNVDWVLTILGDQIIESKGAYHSAFSTGSISNSAFAIQRASGLIYKFMFTSPLGHRTSIAHYAIKTGDPIISLILLDWRWEPLCPVQDARGFHFAPARVAVQLWRPTMPSSALFSDVWIWPELASRVRTPPFVFVISSNKLFILFLQKKPCERDALRLYYYYYVNVQVTWHCEW